MWSGRGKTDTFSNHVQNSGNMVKNQPRLRSLQFDVGSKMQVCISHVVDTGTFYCHLMEYRHQFDELMADMQETYSAARNPATDFKPGDCVIVRSDRENIFQRAKVIARQSDVVMVHCVDFGDVESVPHTLVWQVDDRHLQLPTQAVCCQLEGTDTSPENVADFLKEYVDSLGLTKRCDVYVAFG